MDSDLYITHANTHARACITHSYILTDVCPHHNTKKTYPISPILPDTHKITITHTFTLSGDRERERDRQTDRQTDGQRQRGRHRERQSESISQVTSKNTNQINLRK